MYRYLRTCDQTFKYKHKTLGKKVETLFLRIFATVLCLITIREITYTIFGKIQYNFINLVQECGWYLYYKMQFLFVCGVLNYVSVCLSVSSWRFELFVCVFVAV